MLTHHTATANGIRMHWVEAGDPAAPAVLLAHGFPHTWWVWNRQIAPLVAAGWRVIVPDMRGMGETEAPADPAAYDCHATSGDLAALIDHCGLESAVCVGIDFGIFAIYDLAYLHPGKVRAIVALENPHYPDRREISPLDEAAEWGRKHFVHIDYFREPGVADRDLDAAPRELLTKVFYALSADYDFFEMWTYPPGTPYLTALPEPPPLPWRWLSVEDIDILTAAYETSGFTGGLNWYRAMDIRWHQRHAWRDGKTSQPFYFIGSEHDVDLEAWHGEDPLGAIPNHHGDVRAIEMIPGAGHIIQLEKTAEVNALLLRFLGEISAAA